jgi:hypothetical protein
LAATLLASATPGVPLRGSVVDADTGKPLRPARVEVEFLLKRAQDELARSREILAPDALAEYNEAVEFYRGKLEESR